MESTNHTGYSYLPIIKKEIESLQKIASAIIYDGKVDSYEVEILREWLDKNNEYLTEHPLSDLKALFKTIIDDGVVTESERKQIFEFLDAIALENSSHPNIINDVEKIEFEGKTFAFRGKLLFGDLEKAKHLVEEKGGEFTDVVNPETDYLVIGIFEAGKMYDETQKAIEHAWYLNRSCDADIKVIREKDLVKSVW